MIVWCRSSRPGPAGRGIIPEALLLLFTVLAAVAGEFALDRTDWPEWIIYLVVSLFLLGTACVLLRRLKRTDRPEPGQSSDQ